MSRPSNNSAPKSGFLRSMVEQRRLLACTAIAAFVGGGILTSRESQPKPVTVIPPPKTTASQNSLQQPGATTAAAQINATPSIAKRIKVQIDGAVLRPNVYELDLGARVMDLVQIAGGLRPEADYRSLNFARILKDGEKVDVNFLKTDAAPSDLKPAPSQSYGPMLSGDSASGVAELGQTSTSENGTTVNAPIPGPVSLNQATLADLETLPGVGPSTAQAILDYRTQVGGFRDISELSNVRGIGPKKLEKIRPFVTL